MVTNVMQLGFHHPLFYSNHLWLLTAKASSRFLGTIPIPETPGGCSIVAVSRSSALILAISLPPGLRNRSEILRNTSWELLCSRRQEGRDVMVAVAARPDDGKTLASSIDWSTFLGNGRRGSTIQTDMPAHT